MIRFLIAILTWGLRFEIGGGGGGSSSGDGGYAAGQAAAEAQKAALRTNINQMYGIGDPTTDPAVKAAQDAEAANESNLSNATSSFYNDQLQHDTQQAFRNNRFSLADRGTLGGSAQIDTERELSRDNTLGATRVADQAAQAVAGLKASNEAERLNATNLVNQGAGTDAVAGAQAGLTRSLQNAQAQQHANITSDLFQGGANSVAAANSGMMNPLLLAQYQNKLSSFSNPAALTARSTPTG